MRNTLNLKFKVNCANSKILIYRLVFLKRCDLNEYDYILFQLCPVSAGHILKLERYRED
jgi:hypothetical protein